MITLALTIWIVLSYMALATPDEVPVKPENFNYVSCMQDLSIQDKKECGKVSKTFD